MPTYEYACKSCGEHLEVVQSFKDDALTECPNCSGVLRKVFGNIGIVFKGSGFYKNDSRSGRSGLKPAAAGSSSGSEVATTSSGTEPSKPAAGDGASPSKPAASAAPAASTSTASSGARSARAEAAS
jgi:putative FmdB family regulatory protein